jgi:hypothetical protein
MEDTDDRDAYIERRLTQLQVMLEEAVRRWLAAPERPEIAAELAAIIKDIDYWRAQLG